MSKKESEFGKGFLYNIGLFLAHQDRIERDIRAHEEMGMRERAFQMWFYAAADHMIEFQPESAPTKELVERCSFFQQRCLDLRLPSMRDDQATEEDYNWAIREAKDILRAIDEHFGVETIKGNYE